MAYKDFNIEDEYDVINKEITFKPSLKWWEHKCNDYRYQDEQHNNKISLKIKSLEKELSNENHSNEHCQSLKSQMTQLKNQMRYHQ